MWGQVVYLSTLKFFKGHEHGETAIPSPASISVSLKVKVALKLPN